MPMIVPSELRWRICGILEVGGGRCLLRLLKQIIAINVTMTPQMRPGKKPAIIAFVGKDEHFGVKVGVLEDRPAIEVAYEDADETGFVVVGSGESVVSEVAEGTAVAETEEEVDVLADWIDDVAAVDVDDPADAVAVEDVALSIAHVLSF